MRYGLDVLYWQSLWQRKAKQGHQHLRHSLSFWYSNSLKCCSKHCSVLFCTTKHCNSQCTLHMMHCLRALFSYSACFGLKNFGDLIDEIVRQ